jgi:predicted homoserine dehydrogenase-like protein
LAFPPCGVDDLPSVLRPKEDSGILPHRGWGVYAVAACMMAGAFSVLLVPGRLADH